MNPTRIKLAAQNKLIINWDDGSESAISLEILRRNCPCATCLTERERESKTFIPLLYKAQIEVQNISQVGNYAISISWKDGHNTGIYEYAYLKKLGEL
jgi:DUF971 family protein